MCFFYDKSLNLCTTRTFCGGFIQLYQSNETVDSAHNKSQKVIKRKKHKPKFVRWTITTADPSSDSSWEKITVKYCFKLENTCIQVLIVSMYIL